MLIDGSRLFRAMAGDYVLCLFPGKRQMAAVEHGRQITKDIMGRFADAVRAYSQYCKEYADSQEVTEQLKAENQILWVQKMNNIRACVREIVNSEMIYN